MKDNSELANLLRTEWSELLDQKKALERRMSAIDLLLGGTADEEEAEKQRLDAIDGGEKIVAPAKTRRPRRTKAQIAADNAMAELAAKHTESAVSSNVAQAVAGGADSDEEAAQ
jgi:hypothetical protein